MLGRIGQRGAAGILDHVAVVVGPQQRVERHRNDARLDRAPEQIEELRRVLDHHQQPLARREAGSLQRQAAAIDPLGERAIGDVAGGAADRRLVRSPLREMAVDERHRDIEAGGKVEAGRAAGAVDADGVVRQSGHSRNPPACRRCPGPAARSSLPCGRARPPRPTSTPGYGRDPPRSAASSPRRAAIPRH